MMNIDVCVQEALLVLGAESRARFAHDPQGVLTQDLGLTVKPVHNLLEDRREGGSCDGVSFLQDGVILYAPTFNSRRENFTLAHELGHWLVDQAANVYDWLADQDDPPRLLETVCDRIAQKLLLPENLVSEVLQGGRPCAEHVLRLFDISNASLPACAIALADRLPALGAVVIIDSSSNTISSASVKEDRHRGWPKVFPWPAQRVPPGHPLATIAMRSDASLRQKTYWTNQWGAQESFYVDAVAMERRVVAVFSAVDLWNAEQLHLDPEREFSPNAGVRVRCCGADQTARGFPCNDCGQPYCPQCRRCHCERLAAKEQLCAGNCFMRFQPHLLIGGLCEVCRD